MKITLELDINDTNVILSLLAEMPYKHAAPVIHKIRDQMEAQIKKETEVKSE